MSIMQEEPAIALSGKRFPKLLQCPFGGRMFGHIEMDESPGPNLKSDKDIQDPEACCDYDK